ncbi:MAG TPA: PilZ domain-containing protein [Nitrospiria bacterium]|nr:PilZ domain-containing protein [Nitrospiria bacterium]
MISTAFYERRREISPVDFYNRRITERRREEFTVSQEHRRLASQVRRYERDTFKIPVWLQIQGREICGYTHDISPEGLLVFIDRVLNAGTAMTLKFSFGTNVCHLNVSGQVVFCRLVEKEGSPWQAVGIKFSAIREFEKTILTSAVQELKHSPALQEKSLLNILVSTDTLAHEITDFFERRQFGLPISFSNRRREERRTNSISFSKERRELSRQDKFGLLETLQKDSLKTHPQESIKMVLGKITGIDPNTVEESTEIRSLGLESFEMIEMLAAIETVFNITLDDGVILQVVTVRDLINLIKDYLE